MCDTSDSVLYTLIYSYVIIYTVQTINGANFQPVYHHHLALFKLKETHDCKVTSLYTVHANIRRQGSCAKQECELQHEYPYKTSVGMGRSVQNLSLSQRNMLVLRLSASLDLIVTVAESFDVSKSVIAMLWRRYRETDEFTRREGQGRYSMMSQRENRYLRNIVHGQKATTRVLACNWSMDTRSNNT